MGKNRDRDKYYKIADNYRVLPDGKTFRFEEKGNGNAEPIYMSNFALIPCEIICKRKDFESEPYYEYKYKPLYKGEFGSPFTLDRETILKSNLAKFGINGSRIFVGNKNFNEFQNLTLALLDDESLQTKKVLNFAGMIRLENGNLYFANQGYSIDKNGKNTDYIVELPANYKKYGFVDIDNADLGKWIIELESICPQDVIIPLLSYTVGSFVNFMHYEHDNEDNSMIYLLGESQSGKSTLAKIFQSMMSIYHHAEPASISFANCTINAMKTLLPYIRFGVIVVDDIRLNDTPKEKEKSKDIVKELTETIGNRAVKQILDERSNLADPRISHASVIVTGENDLELSPAANARTTVIEIKKDFNIKDNSDLIQKHLEKVNGIGQDFILFFIQNYERINKHYDEKMDYFNNLISKGKNARVDNNMTHYMFDYWVWLIYLLGRNYIDESEYQEREKTMITVFSEVAEKQNERVADVSITKLALARIKTSLESGRRYYKLLINGKTRPPQTTKYQRQTSTSTCIGYLDNENQCLNVIKDEVFKAIEDYGAFPASQKTLWTMLRDEGYLNPGESRGKGKELRPDKKIQVDGKWLRLISIKLSSFEDFNISGGEKL